MQQWVSANPAWHGPVAIKKPLLHLDLLLHLFWGESIAMLVSDDRDYLLGAAIRDLQGPLQTTRLNYRVRYAKGCVFMTFDRGLRIT